MPERIHLGIIGIGPHTQSRHIPGFHALSDVELRSIFDRNSQAASQLAKDAEIEQTTDSWQTIIDDPRINAVLVGGWPSLHREVTCAALNAGKHVLCEAPMSRCLAQAKQMLTAAQDNSRLVAQVAPGHLGLVCGDYIRGLVEHNYLGTMREIIVIGADNSWWDYSKLFDWRQDAENIGINSLSLGTLHDALTRIVPQPVQVFAQQHTFEPKRPHPEKQTDQQVTVPDSLQAVSRFADGSSAIYHISGITHFGPGMQIHFYGSEGTIKWHFTEGEEHITVGHLGQDHMIEVDVPVEKQGRWRVEEEFISAIRGENKVELNSFARAVDNMTFLQAVHDSAQRNAPVELASLAS